MQFTRHGALLAALSLSAAAQAQISDNTVKIGVLTDMTGTYASMGGPGSIVATKMAIDDCLAAECKGMKLEVVSADHQNKADIAASRAREWLQAQSSKAQVVGLANGGLDTVNAIKSAREFGVGSGKGQKMASLLMFLSDVHALGLEQAQGLMFSEGFYWDMDDKARAFSTRFEKLHNGLKPTMVQAGVYSSVRHYLKAVAAAKTDDSKVVAQKMRELPIDDPVMRNASIRPDGRVIHDMYLFQVKSPAESKGPWDYYKTVSTIPAENAFKPLAQSACPLVKK